MILLGEQSNEWLGWQNATFASPDDGKGFARVAYDAFANHSREAAIAETAQLKRVASASWDMATYVDHSNARSFAEQESLSKLLDAVKTSSGIRLENPLQGGFEDEAERLARVALGGDYARERARGAGVLAPFRMQAFEGRLQELMQSDPKIADAVAVARIDYSPQMIARRAAFDMDAALQDAGGGIALTGQLAGGLIPALREPLNGLGMALSGGGSAAATVGGRLVMTGLREAVVNAGITALQQPSVQAWRNEVGLPSGLGEAIHNIVMAAAIGGTIGVGVQGAHEIIPKFLSGRATAGEAAEIAKAAGLKLSPEDGAVLKAAVSSDADDALVLAAAPRGVPAGEGDALLRQGLRYLDEPGAPPPEVPLALAPARPGAAAIDDPDLAGALAGGNPLDAARILHERPELLDDSLPVDLPAVRQAAQLARLSDEAFGQVEAGLVHPAMAAQVAAQVADPLQHAAVLGEVARLRPASETELREAIADAATGRSAFAPRDQALRPAEPPPEPGTQAALDRAAGGRVAEGEGAPAGDVLPLLSADSEGVRMVTRADAFAEVERTSFAADLVQACKV